MKLKRAFLLALIFVFIGILALALFIVRKKNGESTVNNTINTSSPMDKNAMSDADWSVCKVIPSQYCNQAKIINWRHEGQTFRIIALNLPKGVQIKTPISGKVGEAKNSPDWNGSMVSVGNFTTNTTFTLIGDVSPLSRPDAKIGIGESFAVMNDTGVKNLDDYNLLIRITTYNKEKKIYESDEGLIKSIFPQ